MGIRDPNYLINVNYNELVPKVKEFLKTMTPHNARLELVKAGYSEKNVDNALGEAMKKSRVNLNKNANIILFKDFFDKIGYGFSSPMLMFILLYTINSSILFIGIISGLKSFITLFSSSIVKEYDKHFNIGKKFITTFGTLFGLTFLLMALGKTINSSIIFGIAILLSSLFVVLHGDFYSQYVIKQLSKARSNITAKSLSYFELIITAIILVLAGYLLDLKTVTINLGFKIFTIPGYLLELEIIAIAFILSSYVFSFVSPHINFNKKKFYEIILVKKVTKNNFVNYYFSQLKINFNKFFKNSNLKMLFFGSLFSGTVQTVTATFAGIYIFTNLSQTLTTGFLKVTIIFGIGVIVASIAPGIIRHFMKLFGKTPILVFSVFLISIFPLSLYFNISYYGLIFAHAIAVFGASSLSIVQSFIIKNSLNEKEKQTYFSSVTSIISFILPIIVIIFGILGHFVGLKNLFGIIAIAGIVLIVPFYFALVMRANKIHYKNIIR